MKKWNSELALAVKSIEGVRACFALTGTLIQNRMGEMWSVLDFVRRGWAGSRKEWTGYAVQPISKGHRYDGKLSQVVHAIVSLILCVRG